MINTMPEGKILIDQAKGVTRFLALIDDRLQYLSSGAAKGGVFVGRVENCVSNLRAAFVKFRPDEVGYLSYDDVPENVVCNRENKRGEKLRAGDLLPVQYVRGAQGVKQARLTAALTLTSKDLVLTLGRRGVGASNRLDKESRAELIRRYKRAAEKPDSGLPEQFFSRYGVIIRTEAGNLLAKGAAEETLLSQTRALYETLVDLQTAAKTRTPATPLYLPDADKIAEEQIARLYHFLSAALDDDESKRAIPIVCATPELYETIKELAIVRAHAELQPILHENESGASLDAVYGVKSKLDALKQRVVWLKSGAYLVIDDTEAMTVIDVNSGKNTGEKNGAFAKINLEAADEIMRQIRLRDSKGMIVCDFIHADGQEEKAALEQRLRALCALDPVHTEFVDFTGMGLAEITRSGV